MVADRLSTKEEIQINDVIDQAAEIADTPIRQYQVWSRTDTIEKTTQVIEIAGFYDDHTVAVYSMADSSRERRSSVETNLRCKHN